MKCGVFMPLYGHCQLIAWQGGAELLCWAAQSGWLGESLSLHLPAHWQAIHCESFPAAAFISHRRAPRYSNSALVSWAPVCRAPVTPEHLRGPTAEGFHGMAGASGSSTAAQVRVLVEEGGASFDVRDGYSMDPLDEAMRHRHEDIAALLQSCGALIGGRAPL